MSLRYVEQELDEAAENGECGGVALILVEVRGQNMTLSELDLEGALKFVGTSIRQSDRVAWVEQGVMAVLLRGLVDREDARIECERIFELLNRQRSFVASVGLGLLSEGEATALPAWSMARSELSRCRSSGVWSTAVPLETLRVRSVG